jgi:hypothetical protein
MTCIRCIFLLTFLSLNSFGLKAATGQQSTNLPVASSGTPSTVRIIAVGDVHGALAPLKTLLRGVGLINNSNQWVGNQDILVSLGDLVDRGPDSRAVMDLLRGLQAQAKAQGGRVEVLLGNHEILNLTGELSDVSPAEFASYQGPAGHRAAFAANGEYGKWLLSLPTLLKINDTVFVHGGLSSTIAGLSVDNINAQVKESLSTLLGLGAQLREQNLLPQTGDLYALAQPTENPDSALKLAKNLARQTANQSQQALLEKFVQAGSNELLGEFGPLWYRGNAGCHSLLEQEDLNKLLDGLNATRVVMGHTPTPRRRIVRRLDQRAYSIDTGMLAEVYKGKPYALEIRGQSVIALNQRGENVPIDALVARDKSEQLLVQTGVASASAKDRRSLTLQSQDDASQTLKARFIPMSDRTANRALAAYRLDQLLGLHMVPAVAKRQLSSKNGIFEVTYNIWSDRQRQKEDRYRPNYCAEGSAYLLLAAFDALIGKTDRDADDFGYQRLNWRIVAWNNHRTFGTSTKLPRYSQEPVLSPGMRKQLMQLNTDDLTEHLGDLLNPKEIKALLKRRDLILRWPTST